MPESKKLSELIEKFFNIKSVLYADRDYNKDKIIIDDPFLLMQIEEIKNQIDQKFEELRCECEKDSKRVAALAEPTGIGQGLLKVLQEEKDSKKWKEIDEIISSRIRGEYQKHCNLLPDEIWIIVATKKIISSLKEYASNSIENP